MKTGEVEKEQQLTEGERDGEKSEGRPLLGFLEVVTLSVKLSDMDTSAPKGPALLLACSSWHTLPCVVRLAPQKE